MNKLLRYTGAKKVQVVGHSQGGMMPRYWIKCLGGKSKVEDLVGFAPSNNGTNLGEASSEDSTAEDFNLPAENNPRRGQPVLLLRPAGGRFQAHKEAQRRRRHAGRGVLLSDRHR